MTRKQLIDETKRQLDAMPAGSAWKKGVKEYAADLLEDFSCSLRAVPVTSGDAQRVFLNGARSWEKFSYGGCALIYDGDIASRLCTPSELRRSLGGERNPNRSETWLDVQARALFQASWLLYGVMQSAAAALSLRGAAD